MADKRKLPGKIVCEAANSKLPGYYESSRHASKYLHGIKRNGIRLQCIHNTNFNETEINIEGPDGKEYQVHGNFVSDLEGPWWDAIYDFYNGLQLEIEEFKKLKVQRQEEYNERLRLAEQERIKELSDYWSNK